MYSFNLENSVPSGGLACLITKAIVDESTKLHMRDTIELCGSKGIKREYSNAKTLQQNRVAERKSRTLIEAAKTMLVDLVLPNTFWAEAVSIACYVLNRVLVTKPYNKKPYELITGTSEMEADHAQEYYVLPLWSSYTLTVKSTKAKNGDEKLNEDTDSKTNERAARASSANYVNTGSTPLNPSSTSTNQDDSQIPALEDIYNHSRDRIFTSASYDDEGVVADFTNLETTVNEELLQFKIQKVWILVDLPFGKKAIGTKWVYRNKKDEKVGYELVVMNYEIAGTRQRDKSEPVSYCQTD
nr:putative ribonuclease H-like domain-containing protein [Tanacetum cinerariifolium]